MPLPLLLSEPGPILTYLSKVRALSPDQHDKIHETLRALLHTPEGSILLDLLEKATTLSQTPILADERALFARNAQSFIAADLRRIMSDEYEKTLEQRGLAPAGRKSGGDTPR